MTDENIIVHSLWVGDSLSLLEQLTIKLLQSHGHQVHLWAYDKIENVPSNVVLRNAEEILPKTSIFKYTGAPVNGIPRGGIGSLSHWSDQFQLKLLAEHGGIYTQLDVAYLEPLDFHFKHQYTFLEHAGHQKGVCAFSMKCPKGSEFAIKAYEKLSQNINASTISNLDWDCSMRIIRDVLYNTIPNADEYFLNKNKFLDLGCRTNGPFFENTILNPEVFILHWSNATVNELKNKPITNSFYYKLLKKVGLVENNIKKCAIISCFANNQYRKDLLKNQIKFFNALNIDVILASSDHIDKMDGVKNYITCANVTNKIYLTEDIFSFILIDRIKYYKGIKKSNIEYKNYFFKMYQTVVNYSKNLGYDFCYFIEQDSIINDEHISTAFSKDLDYSKIYFYDLQHKSEYQTIFFYGNTVVLSELFCDNNLYKLENLSKKSNVITYENATFTMANWNKENVIVLPNTERDIFFRRNMFSSRNVADIFYDGERKEYWFLQYKGDTCENEFACELFLDDVLIYSNHFKHTGYWSLRKLENNKNYKIKYYDAAISDLTLSKTLNIYTDTNMVTTPNWIQRI